MDCTPVKSNVSKRDALSYGKCKAKEIPSQVKIKLARSFDFSLRKFDSPEEEEETKDFCKDLDRLNGTPGEKNRDFNKAGEDQTADPGAKKLDTPKNCISVWSNRSYGA